MTRALLLLALCATVLAACGNPRTPTKTFTFTPVAYTVVPLAAGCAPEICSTTIAVDADGTEYYADQVIVQVSEEDTRAVTDWLDQYGFAVTHTSRSSVGGATLLLVRVPAGSVPDAVRLIKEHDGVINATRSASSI